MSRRNRCGDCVGCRAPNCVSCHYCRDMIKFGGEGKMKQACINRVCVTRNLGKTSAMKNTKGRKRNANQNPPTCTDDANSQDVEMSLRGMTSESVVKTNETGVGFESLDDSQTDNIDDSQTENLEHSVSEDNRQYKKINAQLAQTLNYVKVELNQAKGELLVVNGENLALQTENATLRGQVDPQIIEQEVQRRLFECIGPVKDCLNAALDNVVGLSDNLTQGLRLTTATSLVSLNNRQSGSSVALNRNSSIGTVASSFRMQNATNFPLPSSNSPNRALPKSMVSPMVAGHTIKRPKIQPNQIAMQDGIGAIYVGENPVQRAPPQPEQTTEEEEEEEDDAEVESAEEEPEEEIAPSPNRPRRNRFNLIIIGEESRIEDSPLPASQPLDESDEDDGVQVLSGNVVDPDVGLLHTPQIQPSGLSPSSSGRRSRASIGRDLRITTEDTEQDVSRNSSGGIMRSPAGSSRCSLSNTPLGRLSRSPYVDVTRTARPPHLLLSDHVFSASIHSPNTLPSRASSSPVVMDSNNEDNEGLEEEQGRNVFNMPADPSDSFLERLWERMREENPLEAPTWLFANTSTPLNLNVENNQATASKPGRADRLKMVFVAPKIGRNSDDTSEARLSDISPI